MRVHIRHLDTSAPAFEAEFESIRHWSAKSDAAIERRVAEILADVKSRGDAAVLEFTRRFDALDAASVAALELTQQDFAAAQSNPRLVATTIRQRAISRSCGW